MPPTSHSFGRRRALMVAALGEVGVAGGSTSYGGGGKLSVLVSCGGAIEGATGRILMEFKRHINPKACGNKGGSKQKVVGMDKRKGKQRVSGKRKIKEAIGDQGKSLQSSILVEETRNRLAAHELPLGGTCGYTRVYGFADEPPGGRG
ncbi:hypothetical protein DEO72_LG11g2130 [Vigna unguiculata]|uniref:Uncharacterized protein n=1 Tax=Vigna unguiculata TaxID=3917 RepID=A0A4D6NQ74_VIGUN|nr:hypothetical protein DEO72_LG11g2130 [Vigna unguiculata]